MAIEKIKIMAAVLELPAKQHCQSSPFTSKIGPNGLNWQCYLAGSSKTAPRILVFSIAMGAKPSFQLKSIAIWAPAFFMHNNSFIATVFSVRKVVIEEWLAVSSSQEVWRKPLQLLYSTLVCTQVVYNFVEKTMSYVILGNDSICCFFDNKKTKKYL